MAPSPIPVMLIMIVVLAGEALIFGEELAEEAFPEPDEPTSGGWKGALEATAAVIQAIWGGVTFFFSLITFNVPGAPWWIRVILTTGLGGSMFWSVMTLIRGN